MAGEEKDNGDATMRVVPGARHCLPHHLHISQQKTELESEARLQLENNASMH